ncbi:MAG: hypothetical protein KDD60_05265, partial [Bdellovibrionales bacterium]|nr:hypothetical protein [Bdellovibrionales bacterium]
MLVGVVSAAHLFYGFPSQVLAESRATFIPKSQSRYICHWSDGEEGFELVVGELSSARQIDGGDRNALDTYREISWVKKIRKLARRNDRLARRGGRRTTSKTPFIGNPSYLTLTRAMKGCFRKFRIALSFVDRNRNKTIEAFEYLQSAKGIVLGKTSSDPFGLEHVTSDLRVTGKIDGDDMFVLNRLLARYASKSAHHEIDLFRRLDGDGDFDISNSEYDQALGILSENELTVFTELLKDLGKKFSDSSNPEIPAPSDNPGDD